MVLAEYEVEADGRRETSGDEVDEEEDGDGGGRGSDFSASKGIGVALGVS